MDVDPTRVAAARLSPFSGEGWRHLSPRLDPLSGEGARLHGGRFNPAGSFPVLYICRTRPCVVAEFQRLGERQPIGVDGLLPRHLYRYDIRLDRVLDLTDAGTRHEVGIGLDVLTGPDWATCQDLGATAHTLGIQAVLSPSAAGVDDVLAVFVQHIGLGTVEPTLVEEWRTIDDLGTP
ncbi:RES family NAD+ phosphorylase [Rhabdothermincola sediminis]|uniref:RES family NAD+ phosphorylase n=1 Tax=Rhabdothermincola sediminis TaxID=2751370 RepID=UPI001AA04E9E|nr:RES family NAD+ phosphorylase [Rhabdothermincola sediminis]